MLSRAGLLLMLESDAHSPWRPGEPHDFPRENHVRHAAHLLYYALPLQTKQVVEMLQLTLFNETTHRGVAKQGRIFDVVLLRHLDRGGAWVDVLQD